MYSNSRVINDAMQHDCHSTWLTFLHFVNFMRRVDVDELRYSKLDPDRIDSSSVTPPSRLSALGQSWGAAMRKGMTKRRRREGIDEDEMMSS